MSKTHTPKPPFRFRVQQRADKVEQCEAYLDVEGASLFHLTFCDQDQPECDAIMLEIARRLNTYDDLLHACKWVLGDAPFKAPEQYANGQERARILGRWLDCLQNAVAKAEVAP